MSQFTDLKNRLNKQEAPRRRWVDLDEEVELLWVDDQDQPHLSKGKFRGIAIPADPEGGPTEIVIETLTGDESVSTENVVGITPMPAEAVIVG